MSQVSKLEIVLGVRGVIHLAVTPKSTLTLSSEPTALEQLKTKIALEGSCERVPDNTACELVLSREYDGKAARPVLRPAPMEGGETNGVIKVTGGAFKVQRDAESSGDAALIELDVFEHELVGKGKLHCALKPELSGCNSDAPPTEVVFPFDNQVSFKVTPESVPLMGTICTFTPLERTGAFSNVPVRLVIEEYDAPQSPDAAGDKESKDLRVELDWAAGEIGSKLWRVGCREREAGDIDSPAVVDFVYPEPNEVPPYEFAYTVQAKIDESWRTLPYGPIVFAPAVPKPGLSAFELALVQEEGMAERHVQVKLGFTGLAEDISFDVQISIWHVEKVGDELKIDRVALPDMLVTYAVKHGVMTFTAPSALDDLGGCFAVLSLPGVAGSGFGDARIPITCVLDCMAGEQYRAFEEALPGKSGRLLDPGRNPPTASGVASKEASPFLKLDSYESDDLETLALAMCIWTEARDNPDDAAREREMRHVGGVIANRVRTKYWKKETFVAVVLEPAQFSHFNGTNPEKTALSTNDVTKVRAWTDTLKGVDRSRFAECAEVARDLRKDPAQNPFAADEYVRHYYSPRSMVPAGAVPAWAKSLKPGETCMKGGGEVAVPAIDKERFRWYRGIF